MASKPVADEWRDRLDGRRLSEHAIDRYDERTSPDAVSPEIAFARAADVTFEQSTAPGEGPAPVWELFDGEVDEPPVHVRYDAVLDVAFLASVSAVITVLPGADPRLGPVRERYRGGGG